MLSLFILLKPQLPSKTLLRFHFVLTAYRPVCLFMPVLNWMPFNIDLPNETEHCWQKPDVCLTKTWLRPAYCTLSETQKNTIPTYPACQLFPNNILQVSYLIPDLELCLYSWNYIIDLILKMYLSLRSSRMIQRFLSSSCENIYIYTPCMGSLFPIYVHANYPYLQAMIFTR